MGRHSIVAPHRRRVVHVGTHAGAHRSYAAAMLGAFTIAAILTAFGAGTAAARPAVEVPTTSAVTLTTCEVPR